MLKDYNESREKYKNVRQLWQGKQFEDHDPKVDLEINGYMERQVVVDFGSHVNILPWETWISMGRPNFHKLTKYLKLDDQSFIEPIGTLRQVKPSIMGIPTIVDF